MNNSNEILTALQNLKNRQRVLLEGMERQVKKINIFIDGHYSPEEEQSIGLPLGMLPGFQEILKANPLRKRIENASSSQDIPAMPGS